MSCWGIIGISFCAIVILELVLCCRVPIYARSKGVLIRQYPSNGAFLVDDATNECCYLSTRNSVERPSPRIIWGTFERIYPHNPTKTGRRIRLSLGMCAQRAGSAMGILRNPCRNSHPIEALFTLNVLNVCKSVRVGSAYPPGYCFVHEDGRGKAKELKTNSIGFLASYGAIYSTSTTTRWTNDGNPQKPMSE
ncbi:hypothetical protein M422DRAFT_240550 [Sphaerobolus stellatus SS14]|nr:hypothetical protein M422DRAFT_240550 [Sphaerobolus stellatus SS14]